jgi:hypothetical protein
MDLGDAIESVLHCLEFWAAELVNRFFAYESCVLQEAASFDQRTFLKGWMHNLLEKILSQIVSMPVEYSK